ncbi:MAG TPA: quinone-dependent dihydroorotate dehydrogenase [Ktedonobacterales bacterium]
MLYRNTIRPALFAVGRDPEWIHERVLGALALVSRSPLLTHTLRRLSALGFTRPEPREVMGLRFPSPIGLAAGFDKNGVALPALAALGFGFIEAGTVTWHAQPGNPRPRLFRLSGDEALINRMGFNNEGAVALAARLARLPSLGVPLGVSLGKSKVTPLDEAIPDYLASLDAVHRWADYIAVNVSSPNTPGLRALQERERLDVLLEALVKRLAELATERGGARPTPLLVKVAPDLDDRALADLVEVCLGRGASGLIAVNTTLRRDLLSYRIAPALHDEAGGLSGRPLARRATEVVRFLVRESSGRLPVVGCGGIATVDDARRMLDAGASLLQIYTGFIYEGPLLARRLASELARSR